MFVNYNALISLGGCVSTNKSVPIIISFVLVHIAINCGKLGLIFFVCDKRSTTTLQKTKISHPMIFSVELILIRFTLAGHFQSTEGASSNPARPSGSINRGVLKQTGHTKIK